MTCLKPSSSSYPLILDNAFMKFFLAVCLRDCDIWMRPCLTMGRHGNGIAAGGVSCGIVNTLIWQPSTAMDKACVYNISDEPPKVTTSHVGWDNMCKPICVKLDKTGVKAWPAVQRSAQHSRIGVGSWRCMASMSHKPDELQGGWHAAKMV